MPRFSIIIPVYNVEAFLEQCLRSVTEQSYKDYEVILVDDGSPDNCPILCDAWAALDDRIKVIHKENGGAASARNAGIDIAKGEYFLFLDGDDKWSTSQVLQSISDRLNVTHADVLTYNYHKTDGLKDEGVYFKNPDMPVDTSVNDTFRYLSEKELWIACPWNKAVKRDLFSDNNLRFVEGVTSEDIDWCVRMALEAETFDYISLDAVSYLQRETSVSNHTTVARVSVLFDNVEHSIDICNSAEDKKKAELLMPYISYQCSTLLFTVSELEDKEIRNEFVERAKKLVPLLAYSKNIKVRLVRIATLLLGLRAATNLMNKFYKHLY